MAARRHSVGILLYCVALAALLWGYVSLTRTYEDYIELPFAVVTPPSEALLSTVPDRVTVRVRGTGWQLLNMRLLSTTTTSTLDLSMLRQSEDMTYQVSKTDMLRAVAATQGAQVLDIVPASMTLATGDVSVRRVPVKLRYVIRCRSGFMLVREPHIEPASVEVRGSSGIVQTITEWPTHRLVLADQHEGTETTVSMSDSLSTLLRVSPNVVRVRTDVQQIADLVIDDIPVELGPGLRRDGLSVSPSRISVIVQGGVADLAALTPQQLKAVVDDVHGLTTGYARPRVSAPASITVVGTTPSVVRYVERTKSDESP